MKDHAFSLAEANIRYWIWLMERQIHNGRETEKPMEVLLRTLNEIDEEF